MYYTLILTIGISISTTVGNDPSTSVAINKINFGDQVSCQNAAKEWEQDVKDKLNPNDLNDVLASNVKVSTLCMPTLNLDDSSH